MTDESPGGTSEDNLHGDLPTARELIGYVLVALMFAIWAVAPAEPSPWYSALMVTSGLVGGYAIITALSKITNSTINEGNTQ